MLSFVIKSIIKCFLREVFLIIFFYKLALQNRDRNGKMKNLEREKQWSKCVDKRKIKNVDHRS